MISIAVVDDDLLTCVQVEETIKGKYFYESLELSDFSNGKELIESIESGCHYDIVFLDINMPEVDGYDAAVYIRNHCTNQEVYIIFISSQTSNLIPFFSLHPFDYIEKPISKQKLESIVDKVFTQINCNQTSIILKINSKDYNINPNKILYATTYDGRKIQLYMENGEVLIAQGKLSDLFTDLSGISNSFIQCHKSFIVNLKYVESISRTELTIHNIDHSIPISRNFQSQISDLYYKYLKSL